MRPMSSNFDAAMASRIGPIMAAVSTSISRGMGDESSGQFNRAAPCCAIFTAVVLVRSAADTAFGMEEEWTGLVACFPVSGDASDPAAAVNAGSSAFSLLKTASYSAQLVLLA